MSYEIHYTWRGTYNIVVICPWQVPGELARLKQNKECSIVDVCLYMSED